MEIHYTIDASEFCDLDVSLAAKANTHLKLKFLQICLGGMAMFARGDEQSAR